MSHESPFKIVILESIYDQWDSPIANNYFTGAVSLKLKGYKAEYPYGILPVDTTDFVATHHLLCREEKTGYKPVMAYKSITFEKCTLHNLGFPILGLSNTLGLKEHAQAIEGIIARSSNLNHRLSYDSSWTIDPECRKDRELTTRLRSMMTALHSLYHFEANTKEIISLGSLRFKMDRLFTYWGYEPIALGQKTLPEFTVPSYFNEPVMMFHMANGFSQQSLKDAEQFRNLWDDRLILTKLNQAAFPLLKVA